MRERALRIAVRASIVLALLALPSAAAAAARGTVSVFAHIPPPGYPADPRVVGDRVYEGTYDNPYGDRIASRVFQLDRDGHLLKTFVVTGQDLGRPHGVQVAAVDARGRLLLLDKTSGRILRLDPRSGAQPLYARVPDLPLCSTVASGHACSPALFDEAPMPDYAAWGPDGSLYVTDYQQAVIWRVPPGGGTPRIWIADRRLDGAIFGTAGIVLMPDHRTLLFSQASNAGLGGGNPSTGKLYEVAIGADGKPGPLRQIWESGPADAPDGFALAQSGNIYLALVGVANQLVELSPAGHEIARFGTAITGDNGSPVPFDSPSGVSFLGTKLLVANQSYFADSAANQALLALETGEPGATEYAPPRAGLAPARQRRSVRKRLVLARGTA